MKLMQLELKKINWRPYLGAACGLLAFGLFIALLFCFLPESERGVDDAQFSGSWNSLRMLPPDRMPTVSAMAAISPRMWLDTNKVLPSRAREQKRLRSSSTPSGSSPFIGSSSSRSFGSCRSALAMASL